MKLNQKVYELYKLNSEGKKVSHLDIRRSDDIKLVINGICTDVKIDLLFEEISKKFGNVIKGYSILQDFGLVVDKDTREGFLVDKKENKLSLYNVETDENIFFDNIRNPFIQMGDINIDEKTEDRYISILKRAYSQVIDEEIKETKTSDNTNAAKTTETDTVNVKNDNKEELTIEQIEQDFKDDGWNINKIDNLTLFIKEGKTPILTSIDNDKVNELEFISSEKDAESGVIYKFKNENEDIDISLKDEKIVILEPETVGANDTV